MRSKGLRTWGLIAVAAGLTGSGMTSAAVDGPVVPRTSIKLLREVEPTTAIASSPSSDSVVEFPQPIDASEILPVNTSGGVAGAPPGSLRVYGNTIDPITSYYVPHANQRMADDLTLANGPCNLTSYSLAVYAQSGAYDVHTELWTDDPCLPGATAIGDTAADFNLSNNPVGIRQLIVNILGPAIPIPARVWLAVTFSTNNAGWIIAEQAEVGFTEDYVSENDTDREPDFCGLFTFTDPALPYLGFWAEVFCEGVPPIGACCHDVSGTCTDDVFEEDCVGRWKEEVTCDSNPFLPPCGTHACCHPNPVNPIVIECHDMTPQECADAEGFSALGHFCVDGVTCPRSACINRDGDCLDQHGTGGCNDAFCCEKVCAADPSCCSMDWDSACVDRARSLCSEDHCADALPISGAGVFPFGNTTATTDGPIHEACATDDAPEKQIEKDVWYCWTASCTDMVFVRTCGQTTVDTKLAVYEGCACPPTDAALLDCGDDRCGQGFPQATAVFHAVAGRQYLIRLGNYPGQMPGTGSFTISCGPPNQTSCGGTGDCCTAEPVPARGCVDEACCERVCGCDSYCCNNAWDVDCAAFGYQNNGCGADVLCPALCGACSTNTVTFNSPPPGILDAGRPFPPTDATQFLGIQNIQVTAPLGGDLLGCWSVCETASNGPANGIADITDNGGGQFTLGLARPITTGAVTKITYAGNGTFARYIAHPANLNIDGFANATDVQALVDALNGGTPLPVGLLTGDVNRSGAITGADILDAVGLLIGEGAYPTPPTPTPKPVPNANCP